MATPAAPGTKAGRQARIAAILAREQVHSQEQLAGLLSQYTGMHVTQATLSRDLDELGVVRLGGARGAPPPAGTPHWPARHWPTPRRPAPHWPVSGSTTRSGPGLPRARPLPAR